jgi:hypothetical protein
MSGVFFEIDGRGVYVSPTGSIPFLFCRDRRFNMNKTDPLLREKRIGLVVVAEIFVNTVSAVLVSRAPRWGD